MFFEQAKANAEKDFLFNKQNKEWHGQSWKSVAEKVGKLATALQGLGVKRGDRVVLVSENRPEWLIADLAIMATGAISVPTYTTYTARDYLHIIENSRASLAIISTKGLANTFLKAAHQSDELKNAVIIDDFKLEQGLNVEVHCWDSLLKASEPDMETWQSEAKDIGRDDIACLIYTSGTGGAPKGVKIHHGAILHNCEGATKIIEHIGLKNNVFLSFLPLSHAYEHTAGQFLPIALGAQIWYAEGIEKLASNMEEAAPTIMVVVPRLFEMLRTRLTRQMEKETKLKQKLFNRCIELGTKKAKGEEKLTILEYALNSFFDFTVRRKVQKKFGGKVKALVSGGAPLSPDVGYFFTALGLPLLQGYGQTESGPVVSVNPPGAARMHTVGKILDATTVKIAEDGEILIRGELVMKGYWQNDAATQKTVIDNWLHTGDIGKIEDGYLEITDRKKDILVNDKGDNISPQRIEGLLALETEIAQAMVYGDRKPHLVGLIVPDNEWLVEWAKQNKKPIRLAELADDPDLKKALAKAVDRINNRLANVEKIRKFSIAKEPFSIENEQMTPTLKVRRHAVNSVYGEQLEALY
jgi:long-chain acyl-CoA synthetase